MHAAHAASWPSWSVSSCGGLRRGGIKTRRSLHGPSPPPLCTAETCERGGVSAHPTSTAVQRAVAEVEAGADALAGHEPSPPPRYAATTLVAPAVDLSPPALVRVNTCKTYNVLTRRRTPAATRARCAARTSIRRTWLRYLLDDSIRATYMHDSPTAPRAR